MMRKLRFLLLILLLAIKSEAQLVSNLQLPATGLLYKPQLWTMVLTNTTGAPLTIHIEMVLSESGSSQQLLSGVTREITLPAGTTQITPASLFPIQYNSLSTAYTIDNSPNGLLPIGSFVICYNFFKHDSHSYEQILEECHDIVVEPLSPPQLIYPYDATAIEEANPQFSWLPPVPMALFSDLNYDLKLVEINPGQSAADAASQNIPLYQANNLPTNTLLYPLSAPALQFEKQYAWQVTAKSNASVVASSDVWQFSLKQYGTLNPSGQAELPFVKLKKAPESGYAIFVDDLKFDYFNETGDSIWVAKVIDLTVSSPKEQDLPLENTSLIRGENLVKYNAAENSFFIHKHLYQLEISNSRNEVWRLRFEYRKSESSTN
jgi:hypothetical protein